MAAGKFFGGLVIALCFGAMSTAARTSTPTADETSRSIRVSCSCTNFSKSGYLKLVSSGVDIGTGDLKWSRTLAVYPSSFAGQEACWRAANQNSVCRGY